jgi:ABC-2 type transport system ATP-binding protein
MSTREAMRSNAAVEEQSGVARVALSVDAVRKQYTRGSWWRRSGTSVTESLRGVSFELREGETIGLLGPNGAGKTTLLKIIATLLYPTKGKVSLFGKDIYENPIWARRQMGLVTCDERSFYWRLTGRQNLSFFACLYGLGKQQGEDRIEELLNILGLDDAAESPYLGYSSGMKQKMAIARGLLGNPLIALYDEPTRSLDPLSAHKIRGWIAENQHRWQRQARIIATNQLREAEILCDRILILNKGAVIAQGTVQEIRDRWDKRDYGLHEIVCSASTLSVEMRPDAAQGLLSMDEDLCGVEDARLFKVCSRRNSGGLSLALSRLLGTGLNVLRCDAEQVPFDDVFCSLVMTEGEVKR